MSVKKDKKIRRHKKIRMAIIGTKERPRLFVFRSNKHIYVQLIDDGSAGHKAKILASASDEDLKIGKKGKKSEIAKYVGKLIAQKAKELKVEKVVFDRGGLVFHGRIKAVAEGAREEGLKF